MNSAENRYCPTKGTRRMIFQGGLHATHQAAFKFDVLPHTKAQQPTPKMQAETGEGWTNFKPEPSTRQAID